MPRPSRWPDCVRSTEGDKVTFVLEDDRKGRGKQARADSEGLATSATALARAVWARPAAPFAFQSQERRDHHRKHGHPEQGGTRTKRACQTCETRFYDLAREPIVCPSVERSTQPQCAPAVSARVASPTGRTGWRSKADRPCKPPLPVSDQEDTEPEVAQDTAEETSGTVPEDDLVLEQEPDDPNVTDLIGHDIEEPKER